MVCCIATLPTIRSRSITAKAGKMVSIENGPSMASAPRMKARRALEMDRCGIIAGVLLKTVAA